MTTLKHTKHLKNLTEEEKTRIRETQEKEKEFIKKTKETIKKDDMDIVISKLEAINIEDLAKILIEARKTKLIEV
jgi:hypothetical protein